MMSRYGQLWHMWSKVNGCPLKKWYANFLLMRKILTTSGSCIEAAELQHPQNKPAEIADGDFFS